jgi:crotonobetainyl-CoA:carnitine CoA-transferase CaiB-like acyl-CoA transferase
MNGGRPQAPAVLPQSGAHTREILAGLGIGAGEIDRLMQSGIAG